MPKDGYDVLKDGYDVLKDEYNTPKEDSLLKDSWAKGCSIEGPIWRIKFCFNVYKY